MIVASEAEWRALGRVFEFAREHLLEHGIAIPRWFTEFRREMADDRKRQTRPLDAAMRYTDASPERPADATAGSELTFWTYQQVAEHLGLSVRTVQRRCAAGELTRVFVGDGSPRILLDEDLRRLSARRHPLPHPEGSP